MDSNHLVYRLVSIIGGGLTRDIEAEDALTRALARNGGDGLTACNPDAGACPKPCLRHRRVNAGIWPNWRCGKYRRWDFESENCRPCLSDIAPRLNCGTYQDHLAHEELKRKTAAYIQNRRNQEWDGAQYQVATENTYLVDSTPNGASGAFGALLDDMVRQARNISDNMGISPLWSSRWPSEEREWGGATVIHELANEPNPAHKIDTTWYAQYPEQIRNERSEPQWTVTSPAPRPFEVRTYRFDPISITDPPPDESRQPSSSLSQPYPSRPSPQLPSPDSAT